MYLLLSECLDEPAHAHSLIHLSDFLTAFTLYAILVWVVFYCISLCFLVLKQTDMQEIKGEKCFIIVLIKFLLINTYG